MNKIGLWVGALTPTAIIIYMMMVGKSPLWIISPMGGTMSIGLGEVLTLVAGTVIFVLLGVRLLRLITRQ